MYKNLRLRSLLAVGLMFGLLAFVVATPASQASAQGETKTETIALDPFTSIQINGGGSATLTFGATPSVTITGNSLIVDRLDAQVEDGQLVLGSPLTSALDVTGLSELTYEIVAPSIEEIHLAGTVTLNIAAMPAQPSLVIGLTTGAQLNIEAMSVSSLSGKMDLLSNATLGGVAETMQLEINNGSELDATNLQVGSADLVLNGVAKAIVRVTESLSGRAAQGSTVHYISETVTPDMTLTTMAAVYELDYTPWVAPAGITMPAATPAP
ncbi:MAG: DUF2807 domain-containing protein [Thermomicrobiales bacterium]|nr:DUF2807 domain-containing protein [Thermomicrobiales bacterium]